MTLGFAETFSLSFINKFYRPIPSVTAAAWTNQVINSRGLSVIQMRQQKTASIKITRNKKDMVIIKQFRDSS